MFNYTYEMNLEYFANENDLDLAEDDRGMLFIFVDKEDYSKEDITKMINDSGFDFEVTEYDSFYRVL